MIVLGIGSSIEPKENYLKLAICELSNNDNIEVIKISKVYKTFAWGGVAKNEFLNICVLINFLGTATELLSIIQNIEKKLGRVRKEHWGDRTIDIDILLFNDEVINSEILVIPHKYITERNFVLCPLIDVVGDIVINNEKLSYWLSNIEDYIEECSNIFLKG